MTSLCSVSRKTSVGLAAVLLATATLDAGVVRQETTQYSSSGFVAFQERVALYAALHRNLAAPLPPLASLGSRRDSQSAMIARRFLASAIRAARPDAHQGDIFTSDATAAFRNVIAETIGASNVDLLAPLMDENGRLLPGAHPRIHEPFPVLESRELPPLMLSWFPTLPEELEYRIYDYDLVLWDVYADIVVDVIPYALAHPRSDLLYR